MQTRIWLCLFLTLAGASVARADNVTAVTENAFPLSFERDGKVDGHATALVEETFRRAGFEYKIELYPWARALNMATNDPNVLIYSIARTPEREPQFKWVGEIMPIRYSLYKMRDRHDIVIKTLDDAKKYRIGILKDDTRAKYLAQHGFSEGLTQGLQEVTTNALNLRKLESGRIDLVPLSRLGVAGLCKSEGFDCGQFEVAFDLDLPANYLYMAFSKTTPDAVVDKARNAYSALRKEGVVQKILGEYWPKDGVH